MVVPTGNKYGLDIEDPPLERLNVIVGVGLPELTTIFDPIVIEVLQLFIVLLTAGIFVADISGTRQLI